MNMHPCAFSGVVPGEEEGVVWLWAELFGSRCSLVLCAEVEEKG